MKFVHWLAACVLTTLVLAGLIAVGPGNTASLQKLSWITGYWYSPPVWGGLPVDDIDYSALTHIIHFALQPRSDGSLDPERLKHISDYAPDLVRVAHQNGVKVLVSIAQADPGADFISATSDTALPRLVTGVMDVVQRYGYDGVDLDWETQVDAQRYVNLVYQLRSRLDGMTPRGLLTGSFWESGQGLIQSQGAFDQINVMAYDLCSPSEGFSWHNSALFDGGDGRRRTADWRLKHFLPVIPSSKLGLGIPFYGYVWWSQSDSGRVTGPGQGLSANPDVYFLSYRDIVGDEELWRNEHKYRDEAAGRVPFLTIQPREPRRADFVTYDDEISLTEKVHYARSRGLGGVMIWELSGDYFPRGSPRHPLLQAVKAASGRP